MLIKGAYVCRRRSYEQFAFYVLGSTGKFFVEVMTILFLLSTLVAFFVVIGDLGPSIVTTVLPSLERTSQLRALMMFIIAFSVVLPLSLLRNVDSLVSYSSMAFLFYAVFIFRMFVASWQNLLNFAWISHVSCICNTYFSTGWLIGLLFAHCRLQVICIHAVRSFSVYPPVKLVLVLIYFALCGWGRKSRSKNFPHVQGGASKILLNEAKL